MLKGDTACTPCSGGEVDLSTLAPIIDVTPADASHTHTSLKLALWVLPAWGGLGVQYIADVYHKVRIFVVPATVADAI